MSARGGKRTHETVASGMDFSAILILPFSAIVAFATLAGAAIAKRSAPRLIWPFAFSTLAAAPVFLRFPEPSALGLWIFALFQIAFSAAIGTALGGMAARVMIAAISSRRRG